MPVNLHLEQLLVESTKDKKACYEFTTVGAFTVVHTRKLTNMKPVESLMLNDKPFDFNNNNNNSNKSVGSELIENEILLNFYALKLFIQLAGELASFQDANFNKTQVNRLI